MGKGKKSSAKQAKAGVVAPSAGHTAVPFTGNKSSGNDGEAIANVEAGDVQQRQDQSEGLKAGRQAASAPGSKADEVEGYETVDADDDAGTKEGWGPLYKLHMSNEKARRDVRNGKVEAKQTPWAPGSRNAGREDVPRINGTMNGAEHPGLTLDLDLDEEVDGHTFVGSERGVYHPGSQPIPSSQPGFLAPPTAPLSSAHGLGLGPTLVVLDDPSNKYLQAQQSFYATHPPSHTSVTSSIPDVPPPLPVSLPRLPCIPPLVVHQEQLYFDDGLGAPGKCPHDRKWGEIGREHKEERGLGLSDVEMDDFMVDLGDLVSKEYDAWIERCWVEAFHYTYTVSLPAMIIGFIQCGATPTFLRRNIIHGGQSIDMLLAHNFRILLREEHERRMSDEDGSRRGVDIGNLLAGLVPGTMTGNGSGPAGSGSGSGSTSGSTPAQDQVGDEQEKDSTAPAARGIPLSAASSNGDWARKEVEDAYSLSNGQSVDPDVVNSVADGLTAMSIGSTGAKGDAGEKITSQDTSTAPPRPPPPPPPPPPTHLNPQQAYSDLSPSPHSMLNTNPASAGSGSSSNSTFQHPQQRHLWDPARTGYGNGVCFYDLALLHGREGDDHAPCMCDLTACRTCFHELLYFRGRREIVHPHNSANGDDDDEEEDEEEGEDDELVEEADEQDSHGHTDYDEADEGECNHDHDHDHDHSHDGEEDDDDHRHHHSHHHHRHHHHHHHHQSHGPQRATPSEYGRRTAPLQIKHPDMADIMLVEEHLRTRLHYMASPDVVLRYGDEDEFIPPMEYVPVPNATPATDSTTGTPIDEKTDGLAATTTAATSGGAKKGTTKKILQGRKMKGGRVVKGGIPPKIVTVKKEDANGNAQPAETQSKAEGDVPMRPRLNGSQLPLTWTMESASSRNMAVTLTYRYLVKLLHVTAVYLSPFDFDEYADDAAVLTEIHPLAVYRRLVEPYVRRRAAQYEEKKARDEAAGIKPVDQDTPQTEVLKVDYNAWRNCMEKWEKEVAVREKEGGNAILKTQPARAVAFYTQAICLDSENPVYYLNRAAAFNAIENYEDAEIDCSRALLLNKSHLKAWYRRAIARKGLGRFDEAEQDMLQLLSQAPNIQAATAELAAIRKEIEEMKKREDVDEVD